jgi:menaquinone-dependent protoporphyrinogen oxidase
VLGGALYMGRLHPDARRFAERHSTALGLMPLAVFAMGPKRLEDNDVAGARKQLDVALVKLPISPQLVAIFGGVIDPAKLRFPWKRLPASDARDWEAIRSWAEEAGALFATTAVEAEPTLA